MSVDVTNKYCVASTGGGDLTPIVILRPPRDRMTAVDALTLAAWLVVLAEPKADRSFKSILEAVQET